MATCPEIGTVSQGKTTEEALKNLRIATELYLEEFPVEKSVSRSIITTFEVAPTTSTPSNTLPPPLFAYHNFSPHLQEEPPR